ncbi:hypothetical protein OX88_17560, partial [Pseudomonas coronafaciens pv. porri]
TFFRVSLAIQALHLSPSPSSKPWEVGMLEKIISVASDGRWLNKHDFFFGHDFVLAAHAAEIELIGVVSMRSIRCREGGDVS